MSSLARERGFADGGTWSYDGSLEGLFLLAHRACAELSAPEAVANALATEGELFALLGPAPLRSEPSVSAETALSELRSFSCELFDLIMRIWMSEEALELPLFRVCAAAASQGDEVLRDFGDPDIRALFSAARRVDGEMHRFRGLARFSPRKDGLFSAPLEPDCNIVPALLPHFAQRFGSEDFALVDLRRRLAFARRGGAFESRSGNDAWSLLPDAVDDEEESLWKRYFVATDNPSRRNPELQRRLMPRRYWRFLPEVARSIMGT
jgi:probable DNA metabolism protein